MLRVLSDPTKTGRVAPRESLCPYPVQAYIPPAIGHIPPPQPDTGQDGAGGGALALVLATLGAIIALRRWVLPQSGQANAWSVNWTSQAAELSNH